MASSQSTSKEFVRSNVASSSLVARFNGRSVSGEAADYSGQPHEVVKDLEDLLR